MPLIPQDLHLGLRQPRKAKHTNLRGNMRPGTRCPLLLQPLPQPTAHLLDPSTHRPQISLPLLEQNRVIQDTASNARTVRRRVGNLRPLQDSQLGSDMGIGS